MRFVVDVLVGAVLMLLFAAVMAYTASNLLALMDERYKRK